MEPEKKTPEEEKKPAPVPEQKDEPKPEEKPADNKQTDDNGTADKPDESKADDKKDDKPEEKADKPEPPAVPDAKDEEILRLKTQIAAMSLGVKPDCMDDAVAIAESYVKSGKSEDINSALSAVVKKYPDMKADVGDSKKQGGFKVGAGSSDKEEKPDNSRLDNAFGIKKKK